MHKGVVVEEPLELIVLIMVKVDAVSDGVRVLYSIVGEDYGGKMLIY